MSASWPQGTPIRRGRLLSDDGEEESGYFSANEDAGNNKNFEKSSNKDSHMAAGPVVNSAIVVQECIHMNLSPKTENIGTNSPIEESKSFVRSTIKTEIGSSSLKAINTGTNYRGQDQILLSSDDAERMEETKATMVCNRKPDPTIDRKAAANGRSPSRNYGASGNSSVVVVSAETRGTEMPEQESRLSMPPGAKTIIWDRRMAMMSKSPRNQLIETQQLDPVTAAQHSLLQPNEGNGNGHIAVSGGSFSCCRRASPLRVRRYQVWQGQNRFLCCGRILFGVHTNHLVQTVILILTTWTFYVALVAPFVGYFQAEATLIALGFLVGNISLLIATATTDPGIVPRRDRKHVQDLLRVHGYPLREDEDMEDDMMRRLASSKGRQYCASCRILRPKRTKHCKHCDNCVRIFDHHCPWTGTCIGQRNYTLFLAFVCSVILGACYFLVSTVFLLLGWIFHYKTDAPYARVVALIIGISWSLMIICLVGMLLIFHVMLMRKGMTTSEFLRNAPTSSRHGDSTHGHTPGAMMYDAHRDTYCYPLVPTLLLPLWDFVAPDDYCEDDDDMMASAGDVEEGSEEAVGCCGLPPSAGDSAE